MSEDPRRPSIYEALRNKLGREPTRDELRAEFNRILEDAQRERAEAGKMAHQRKRK